MDSFGIGCFMIWLWIGLHKEARVLQHNLMRNYLVDLQPYLPGISFPGYVFQVYPDTSS